jgi:hypothetical protein
MHDLFHGLLRNVHTSRHVQGQKKPAVSAKDAALAGNSEQQIAFDSFIEAVKQNMQPEGRAQHMAGMHQHLRTLLPDDVTLADLVTGWQVLAQPRPDSNSEVLHRRKTCGELATIAVPLTKEQGKLTGAVSAWQVWLDASERSTDPRLTAMRQTFMRELAELQSAQ